MNGDADRLSPQYRTPGVCSQSSGFPTISLNQLLLADLLEIPGFGFSDSATEDSSSGCSQTERSKNGRYLGNRRQRRKHTATKRAESPTNSGLSILLKLFRIIGRILHSFRHNISQIRSRVNGETGLGTLLKKCGLEFNGIFIRLRNVAPLLSAPPLFLLFLPTLPIAI